MRERPRRWWRWVLGALFGGLALVVVVLVMAWSLLFAPAGAHGRFVGDVERLVKDAREAEGEDAWPVWERAIALHGEIVKEVWGEQRHPATGRNGPFYDVVHQPPRAEDPPEWLAQETARVEEAVRRGKASGLDAVLARLCELRRVRRPTTHGALMFQLMPEMGGSRSLSRYGGARMRLAAERGDWDEWLAAMEGTLALSRLCGAQHTAIDHLVSYGLASNVLNRAREDVEVFHPSEHVLNQAGEVMDRQLGVGLPSVGIEGERLAMLDMVEIMYSDDGAGDGWYRAWANPSDSPEAKRARSMPRIMSNVLALRYSRKMAVVRSVDEVVETMRRIAAKTRHSRESFDPGSSATAERTPLRWEKLVPSLLKYVDDYDSVRTEIGGTRLFLAIERHRAREGRDPGSLAELIPGDLAQIPEDAVSERAWGYRVLEGDPRGYVLYSWGHDQQDDGGKDGEGSLRRDAKPGTDWVVNGAGYRRGG